MPVTRKLTGGFMKPVQWGPWIRDELVGGRETWGYQLYGEYKAYVLSFPLRGNKGKRRVGSYRSFTTYLYVLRELGLIENVREEDGEIKKQEAMGKDGNPTPDLSPRYFFRAVMSKIGDIAWGDPWFAYLGYKPSRKPQP